MKAKLVQQVKELKAHMQDFVAWASVVSLCLAVEPTIHIAKFNKGKEVASEELQTNQPKPSYFMLCRFLVFDSNFDVFQFSYFCYVSINDPRVLV